MTYHDWLAGQAGNAIDGTKRAIDAWGRIQKDPASITVVREDASTLAAQTVRVVIETTRGDRVGDNIVSAATREAVVFGVKGHPTVADTDIRRGDQFRYKELLYKVHTVAEHPGEVQARAEAQQ